LYHSLFPIHQSDQKSGNRSFDYTRDLGVQSVEKTNNDQKKTHTKSPQNKKGNQNTVFCLSLLSPSRRQAATERPGENWEFRNKSQRTPFESCTDNSANMLRDNTTNVHDCVHNKNGNSKERGSAFLEIISQLREQTSVTYRTSSQIWFPFSVSEQCRDIENAEIRIYSTCRAGSQFEVPKKQIRICAYSSRQCLLLFFPSFCFFLFLQAGKPSISERGLVTPYQKERMRERKRSILVLCIFER
jgi:hypothetical protein